MDLTRIKDNIRAMLNLAADDGAADGEIANAMRFAKRLMDEHNITEDEVRAGATESKIAGLSDQEMNTAVAAGGTTKRTAWEESLGWWVCRFVGGVKYWLTTTSDRTVDGIMQSSRSLRGYKFWGLGEDAEIAARIFEETRLTVAAMSKLRWGGVFRGEGREYCEGFVEGLSSQLRESQKAELAEAEQQDAIAGPSGTALMVVESRNSIVAAKEEILEQRMPKGHSYAAVGYGSYSEQARSEGRADGKRHKAAKSPSRRIAAS